MVHLLHHAPASAAPHSYIWWFTLESPEKKILINWHWPANLSSLLISILSFWSIHSVSVLINWKLPMHFSNLFSKFKIRIFFSILSYLWFQHLRTWTNSLIFNSHQSFALPLSCSQYWSSVDGWVSIRNEIIASSSIKLPWRCNRVHFFFYWHICLSQYHLSVNTVQYLTISVPISDMGVRVIPNYFKFKIVFYCIAWAVA